MTTESFRNKPVYTLLEIGKRLQQTIADNFSATFWVKSEINKLNYYSHSGHAYPELLEKKSGKVIAQMRSVMWRDDFDRVNAAFVHSLKEPLKDGIKVMMLCTVQFDPAYGLSLRIHDIDPAYTLGDLELEKHASIDFLRNNDLFDLNKSRELALLPKRLAIISVESSKGYADFTQVIDKNPWGYQFFYMLFPALLQGEAAVKSIIWQLLQIKKVAQNFDAVAIIRGGGGDVGLSCYNHIDLASCIATFPLPVFTGIGHATNETVSEMVAWYNAITPTKLADFLIQKYHDFSVPVQSAERILREQLPQLLKHEQTELGNTSRYLRSLSQSHLNNASHSFSVATSALKSHSVAICQTASTDLLHQRKQLGKLSLRFNQDEQKSLLHLQKQFRQSMMRQIQLKQTLQNQVLQHAQKSFGNALKMAQAPLLYAEQNIQRLSTEFTLKRGFSVTRKDEHSISSVKDLQTGDTIKTQVKDGTIISTIQTIHTHESDT